MRPGRALAALLFGLGLVMACADDSPDDGAGAADAAPAQAADADPTAPDAGPPGARPRVILLIGDGMGPGQLDAASLYRHGATGQLFMQSLPARGRLDTGNLSGTTDSAASATTMATGARTWNGVIGLDRRMQPVETLVERAKARGLASGVVTTASLPHATPAAFTAHAGTRSQYVAIADQQALVVQPDLMLGGGLRFYLPAGPASVRDDAGLLLPLAAAGYAVVHTATELAALPATPGVRVAGVFADEHMTYTLDRAADSTEPTLPAMATRAIELLDADPDGFFLMIEGARIDMASHGNDAANAIHETLVFDDTVRAVVAWAEAEGDVTVLVTADHETGGLEIVAPAPAGSYPTVAWRWGLHTNTRVGVFGTGPGSEIFHEATRDHAWIHAALRARIDGGAFVPPARVLVPDGAFGDLRWPAATQTVVSGFGPGHNQLDALFVDADDGALAVGVTGFFEWGKNAVVVLVDADFGAGTGAASLSGSVYDVKGRIDALLAASSLGAPPVPGFGADFAVVLAGGADPRVEDLLDDGGLRGLYPAQDLPWLGVASNFADGARVRSGAAATGAPASDAGLEVHVPWRVLYPMLAGAVPPGARVAIAVVLVNDDGGYTANQALPPFPAGTANPGRTLTPLPGVVVFTVDDDGDGRGDGERAPGLLP